MSDATPSLVQTFMTHRMDDDAIRMLATGREDETRRVMDAVERSLQATPGALQHLVLYGPRGIGKSFMTRLVQIECARLAATRDLPIPFVLLPEEQHNLTRNPHALPAYIAHWLADWRTGEDHSWQGGMFQWPDPDQEVRQWDEATTRLETELDLALPGSQGMAIVVIENFDMLLASVFKDDTAEQRLRKWLDRDRNRLMLIATATGTVDMDYERPLFQAFQSIRLEPWSQDCCIVYFNRRRESEGKPPLALEQEAKARAIADFIGGSPRLAQLLAEVIETQDALSVSDTMQALADKLADYYRRRIDDLPPLAQGLLDALIRGGEPASQTQLAERVGAPGQRSIARLMQDLQRGDLIRGIPARDSRETLYRVTDRVFVHFYRLRQGHQQSLRTPLATILDFLRAFYTHDEHRTQAARHLAAGRPAEARLFADLAREGGPDGTSGNGYLTGFAGRLGTFARICTEPLPEPTDRILEDLERCPEDLVGRLAKWSPRTPLAQSVQTIITAQGLARLGLEDEAEQRLQAAIESSQDLDSSVLLHHEIASLFWHARNDRANALRHLSIVAETDRAELSPCLAALVSRDAAFLLGQLGRHEEAIETAREAARLAELAQDRGKQAEALRYAAFSLDQLDRDNEAVETAREAARVAESAQDSRGHSESLRFIAYCFGKLKRHEEAVAIAMKAAQIAEQIQDRSEQIAALQRATFSFGQMGRHEEAVTIGQKAVQLAKLDEDRREQVATLRHIAFSLGALQRHEEAVDAASEAAKLAELAQDRREQAGALRHAAFSLGALGRHEQALAEALSGFRLALSISHGRSICATAREAVKAAMHIPSPEAIKAFATWVEHHEQIRHEQEVPDWRPWVGEALAATARAGDWETLDGLIATHPDLDILAETPFGLAELGETLARIGAEDGRAAGFDATRNALRRLEPIWSGPEPQLDRYALTSLVSAFARNCRDPGLLRDTARLLAPWAPDQAELLSALAEIDESDDHQALLARQDPDLALWLRRVRDLPEPEARAKHRGSRRG